MRASLRYVIEVEDEAELTRLRDDTAKALEDQTTVTLSSSSIEDSEFTAFGSIKGKPSETWREVVRAQDTDEAEAKALEADDKRTVVVVLAGVVEAP